MSEHPLGAGQPDDTTTDVPAAFGSNGTPPADAARSIVDAVLDLDSFLSGDVRLAVKQAAWYTRPELEAEIEQLNAELDSLTDSNGRPLPVIDASIGDGERSASVVAEELMAVQKEYTASRRVVLMQQLDEDDWAAFQTQWKDALAKEPPYPPDFYTELITRSALKPRITPAKLAELRKRVGRPVYEELWRVAWAVNTMSGVNIPKSSLSSAVLRGQQPDWN